jgi:hypothetical protein
MNYVINSLLAMYDQWVLNDRYSNEQDMLL